MLATRDARVPPARPGVVGGYEVPSQQSEARASHAATGPRAGSTAYLDILRQFKGSAPQERM
jgi:hypothetical protein